MHITPRVILNANYASAPVSRSGGVVLLAERGFGLTDPDAACDEHSQRVDRSHGSVRVGQAPYRPDVVDEGPQQRQQGKSYPFEDLVEPVGQPVGLALLVDYGIGHCVSPP